MKAVPFKLNCFIQIKSENGKSERQWAAGENFLSLAFLNGSGQRIEQSSPKKYTFARILPSRIHDF